MSFPQRLYSAVVKPGAVCCGLRCTLSAVWLPETRVEPTERRWWQRASVRAWVLLTSGVALVGVWASLNSGSSGDPGGHIMSQLRSVGKAVPPRAQITSTQYVEPHQDSCDGNPATRGLTDVTVVIDFRSSIPASQVVQQVARLLGAQGWDLRESQLSPGPGGQWEKRLKNGTTAHASLGLAVYGSWDIQADAPPVGRQVTGC